MGVWLELHWLDDNEETRTSMFLFGSGSIIFFRPNRPGTGTELWMGGDLQVPTDIVTESYEEIKTMLKQAGAIIKDK